MGGLVLPDSDTERSFKRLHHQFSFLSPESPGIGKGGWPGTAELAAVQNLLPFRPNDNTPTLHEAPHTVTRSSSRTFTTFMTFYDPPRFATPPSLF